MMKKKGKPQNCRRKLKQKADVAAGVVVPGPVQAADKDAVQEAVRPVDVVPVVEGDKQQSVIGSL